MSHKNLLKDRKRKPAVVFLMEVQKLTEIQHQSSQVLHFFSAIIIILQRNTNNKWVIACRKDVPIHNQRETVRGLWANLQVSSKSIERAARALPYPARSGAKQPKTTHSITLIIISHMMVMYPYIPFLLIPGSSLSAPTILPIISNVKRQKDFYS